MTANEIPRTIRFFWDHFTLTTWKHTNRIASHRSKKAMPHGGLNTAADETRRVRCFRAAAYTPNKAGDHLAGRSVGRTLGSQKNGQALAERLRFESCCGSQATFVNLLLITSRCDDSSLKMLVESLGLTAAHWEFTEDQGHVVGDSFLHRLPPHPVRSGPSSTIGCVVHRTTPAWHGTLPETLAR